MMWLRGLGRLGPSRKMICGGCSLSRHQHYRAVPDRWSVAMSTTVATLIGLIIGLMTGTVVAGLALMEHPRRWVVCLRLPEPKTDPESALRARARGSDQETALAEPRRLHPKRQRRRRSRCSFVRHAPFLFWPLAGPSVPPEPLEAVRREGGVAHGRGDRRWPR